MKTLLWILFFASFLYADPLTWDEVLRETTAKNPALLKAEKSLETARLNYLRSFSNFLPQVSASAVAGRSQFGSMEPTDDYSYGISGSLSLFSGLSDVSETRIKNIEYKIAQANYERAKSDAVYRIRRSFDNLLWAQEMTLLSAEILKRRTENFELVRLKYESGREDLGTLMRAEADKVQAEYELAKSKRYLRTASSQMLKDMGRDDFSVVTVTGSFASGRIDENISPDVLVEKIPEYVVAEYNLRKSQEEIKSARSQFFPDLSVSAGASKSGDKWLPENDRWSAGLNLSYLFFPGGRNVYNLKIAENNKALSDETLRETKHLLRARVETAFNDLVDSAENVKVREVYYTAARERAKITAAKYVNGLVLYYEWDIAESDFINAQKALLNAKRDASLAEASWANILGKY